MFTNYIVRNTKSVFVLLKRCQHVLTLTVTEQLFTMLSRPHFSPEHNTHYLLLSSFLLSPSISKWFRPLWQRHNLFHPGDRLSVTRFVAGGSGVVVVVVVVVTSSSERASLLFAGVELALSPWRFSTAEGTSWEECQHHSWCVFLCIRELGVVWCWEENIIIWKAEIRFLRTVGVYRMTERRWC